jgi:tRNA1Val (adenine37-N6)-methyltransferase
MRNIFKFKEFSVSQDQCAMKIGTDSVLLGAWAPIEHHPLSILDIGAGTGVLSLMLAQRSDAMTIDAIEIDDDAYEQCVENLENSPWSDRLFCYHASLEEFTEEIEEQYDLIICNPPFYLDHYKTDDKQRDLARFQDAMPFEHLLESVSKLLSNNGRFAVVIPFKEETCFSELAQSFGLHAHQILRVRGNTTSQIVRSLMYFGFENIPSNSDELIIETGRHQYTDEYINLTKEFYLKM